MNNYLLTIQYDGTRYNGWQRQKNTDHTIQAVIESTLCNLLQEEIVIHGAGRTDGGVHAFGQMANFKTTRILEMNQFLVQINKELPDDIKIMKVDKVDQHFHSRLSAVSKIYSYHVCCEERANVFQRKYVYQYGKKIDIIKMRKAAEYLTGMHDFRGFSSEKNLEKSCIRNIYQITIEEKKEEVVFRFHGNGFLYNMVRIITGTLLEIGTGERSIEQVEKALTTGKREFAGGMVIPDGLFLDAVFYQ